MHAETQGKRAVFLDRDGTLNVEVEFAHRVDDLRLLPGVVEGLRRMTALGFELYITTNQSGIGRGIFSEAEMQTFNGALCGELAAEGITIAGIYFCPFHPTEGLGRYCCDSPLRKPRPGMILLAAAEHTLDLSSCFAIGDRTTDVLAGRAAGCRTILVRTGHHGGEQPSQDAPPDFIAPNLVAAARFIEDTVHGALGQTPSRQSPIPAPPSGRWPYLELAE